MKNGAVKSTAEATEPQNSGPRFFFLTSLNSGRRPAAGDFGACNARRQAYEMSRRGSVRDTNAHLAIWTKDQIPRTSESRAANIGFLHQIDKSNLTK